VEKIAGHRTVLVQHSQDDGEQEDRMLEQYAQHCAQADRVESFTTAFFSRGWLMLSLSLMAPSLIKGAASSGAIAITLGGTLLAFRGFVSLISGLRDATDSLISWRELSPIMSSVTQTRMHMTDASAGDSNAVVLAARQISFHHDTRAAVLSKVDLSLNNGERVLLGGSSGSGKSTLAHILAGIRRPTEGLLLLHGMDPDSWGLHRWRRRVVLVSQFHENHILTTSLLDNVLLGLTGEPTTAARLLARSICEDLGLGDLIARMPGGMAQTVGDMGWRLSHGERSRIFIARALVQAPDVLILDESMAALDPWLVEQTRRCVLKHANTLIIIDHN